MKYQIIALICLLLTASCEFKPNSKLPNGTSAEAFKQHKRIAKEIVSIEYGIVDALLKLNNSNAASFVKEAGSLADRLNEISNELDTLGPFTGDLRTAAIKDLEGADKALGQIIRDKLSSPQPEPLRPDVNKIVDPTMDKFLSAWASVMSKGGLLIEAKTELRVDPVVGGTKSE